MKQQILTLDPNQSSGAPNLASGSLHLVSSGPLPFQPDSSSTKKRRIRIRTSDIWIDCMDSVSSHHKTGRRFLFIRWMRSFIVRHPAQSNTIAKMEIWSHVLERRIPLSDNHACYVDKKHACLCDYFENLAQKLRVGGWKDDDIEEMIPYSSRKAPNIFG